MTDFETIFKNGSSDCYLKRKCIGGMGLVQQQFLVLNFSYSSSVTHQIHQSLLAAQTRHKSFYSDWLVSPVLWEAVHYRDLIISIINTTKIAI